jgi:hypothetical protein
MNEEGQVRKIKTGNTIFPSPLGSDTINLFVDVDNKKKFLVSELLFETHGIKKEEVAKVEALPEIEVPKAEKKAKGGKAKAEKEKPVKVAKEPKAKKEKAVKEPKVKKEKAVKVKRAKGAPLTFKTNNAKEKKIMDLDCKLSIKMYKLSQMGLTVDEIRAIIPYPENWPTAGTIAKYKDNETLRNRADAIK